MRPRVWRSEVGQTTENTQDPASWNYGLVTMHHFPLIYTNYTWHLYCLSAVTQSPNKSVREKLSRTRQTLMKKCFPSHKHQVYSGERRTIVTIHDTWYTVRAVDITNDHALFARFARSNLNFHEPGNGDTKFSGKGRGEDTCYMSHVILARLETWVLASLCLEVHNNCSCVVVSMFQSFIHLNSTAFVWFLLFMM